MDWWIMDERLLNAFKLADYRKTLINQIEQLKSKTNEQLTYAFEGGFFIITPALISFVKILVDDKRDSVVILDKNDTPILIPDISIFYSIILGIYIEVSNQYYFEYKKLEEKRTVTELLK
jgi:hypothetical protein